MDRITKELDELIVEFDFKGRSTDVACYNKIKMDYYLMLTIAVTWDIKRSVMGEDQISTVISCLQRPETGKLIKILDVGLGLNKGIVDIFNSYKEGRNLRFGHTTFDEYEAVNFNSECEQCYRELMEMSAFGDGYSEKIRTLYQEDNDFYYIVSIMDGKVLLKQFGNKSRTMVLTELEVRSRMINKSSEIREGELFIMLDTNFVKVSPFISYNNEKQLFMMLMDIETTPLAFKMAYVYRTSYARDSVEYLDEFPKELVAYFPNITGKLGKNGVVLNKFSQYELFEQDYYHAIHKSVQNKLDDFIVGNMAYGAVRGVGGVGKTSAVFMWISRILNNEEGILDTIRERFNLRKIIFLSAKTKIYSRNINAETYSNFCDIESDVSDYKEIVNYIYGVFHTQEKEGTTFREKLDYIKNYSNQTHAILVIIDDYESLPSGSREEIQKLKDFLNPNMIKFLITTRFASKESKDIIVEQLNEDECSEMTDYVFGDSRWRKEISASELYKLTNGLPLLIWYAKAYYKIGQLKSEKLKKFSGEDGCLGGYLYDNFVQCFTDEFTKNFLMIATKYYELHKVLQISKKIAVFLAIKEPKEYKIEDEEFYFQELLDLKLISINQSSNIIDFSPLMTYMDKSSKKQEPENQYQEDSIKVLIHLDEKNYKDIDAVTESLKYLEDEIKSRILYRIIDFAHFDISAKTAALNCLFGMSEEKFSLYKNNITIFQSNEKLISAMLEYLLECKDDFYDEYKLVLEFLYSNSIHLDKENVPGHLVTKEILLINRILKMTLDARMDGKITNSDVFNRANELRDLLEKFFKMLELTDEVKDLKEHSNEVIDEIDIYASIENI